MSGERVSDHYDDAGDFKDLLDAAEKTHPNGKAAEFVDDMKRKFQNWGSGMFLSGSQKEWLERIAEDAK